MELIEPSGTQSGELSSIGFENVTQSNRMRKFTPIILEINLCFLSLQLKLIGGNLGRLIRFLMNGTL